MVNDYILEVIGTGDLASKKAAEICNKTCSFRQEVSIADPSMGGLTVIRLKPEQKVAVHSAGGSPAVIDACDYAFSLVENLVMQARKIGAQPIAMTNTLDMSKIDIDIVGEAANALYDAAEHFDVAIVNGEIAGLGNRVNAPFNISGTMVSAITEDHESGTLRAKDVEFAIFNHQNMPIFMNSDGVGTKIEIAERTMHHTNMHDLFAMLMDDAIKKAAEVKVLSAVYESREKKVLLESLLRNSGKKLAKQTGITFTMQAEEIGERVNGYGPEPYNLGGTCVSLIDEKALANPPVPKPGNYIIAIRNKDNPTFRSNGITKVREGLKQIYGDEWHTQKFNDHRVGKLAGAPSTVFYPVFRELWGRKFATCFYHMSGGAHKGKFALPLAKQDLYAEISDLFEPPALMQKLVEHYKLTPAESYEIWNMGNEGYITTARLNDAVGVLRRYGLEGKSVGVVTAAHDKTGLTIKLKDAEIYYPGK